MSKERVVFIGGASSFVPGQIQVMLEKKEVFDSCEIVLYDINSHYLPLITEVSKELVRRAKGNFKVVAAVGAEEALEGATYVNFMWNVGGNKALRNDVAIPTSFGISGDETGGIGGTFMAQRNIPVALDYCRIVEKVCPDAWIISHSNPTNLMADAIWRQTKVRFVPICDSFMRFSMRDLPKWLGIPPYDRHFSSAPDLWPRAIGVNHFTWLVDLKVNGKDGYPMLRKVIQENRDKFRGQEPYVLASLPLQLFDTYGYWCIAPLHAVLYFEQKEYLARTKNFESLFYADGLGWNADRERIMKEILAGKPWDENPTGVRPKDFAFYLYSPRQAIGIMASIAMNEGREWAGINFINDGAIPNLPREAVVEGPSLVNARGVHPVKMCELPKPFVGLSQQLIVWQQLSVDAALSGDKGMLYQAILACPFVLDMTNAKAIMEEMLKANAEHLPQYFKRSR